MINRMASMLLYVPFNRDYVVEKTIIDKMSEYDFFEQCYVEMTVNEVSKKIKKINVGDFEQEDEDIVNEEVKNERIKRLKELKADIENFERWIEYSGNAVYCIKGNAGSGKSTYLHYLKHIYKGIKWEIVDIQKSSEKIDILNQTLIIPQFQLLDYKVISAMLDNILNYIFIRNADGKHSLILTRENIFCLYQGYKQNVEEDFPDEIIEVFFENASFLEDGYLEVTKEQIIEYARHIYIYLQKLLDCDDSFEILDRICKVYMRLLECKEKNKKHIIAFDNFERFIGADEICNKQLWKFIEELRHILQACENRTKEFSQYFQMMLFMRNTSSRMGNIPLQLIDFEGHELDLSDWFPINQIINKKLDWYEREEIDVPYGDIMRLILGDTNFDGRGMRSLQTRLSMLYNYNKRVLVRLLATMISEVNDSYLQKFCEYAKEGVLNDWTLERFAGRSIIMRLVLDMLQDDNFFKSICVDKKISKKSERYENEIEDYYERLGIARKILTILHEFSLVYNKGYMLFDDLIIQYRNEGEQSVDGYFDNNYRTTREKISKILYHMNYYNGRKKEWMHFIDVQYNPDDAEDVYYVMDAEDFDLMIEKHHKKIGIRIMPAGSMYLRYIVQSFEYFACRNGNQLPPLLTLIPELNELDKHENVCELECFKVIDNVLEDVRKCILHMNDVEDNSRILYKRSLALKAKKHSDRIIDSHKGYITNFQQCIKKKYEGICLNDTQNFRLESVNLELNKRKQRYEILRNL